MTNCKVSYTHEYAVFFGKTVEYQSLKNQLHQKIQTSNLRRRRWIMVFGA